jgi:protein TonB
MSAIAAQDHRGLGRWLVGGVVALGVHAAVVAALIQWREPIPEGDLGNDVILLELRPEQIQAEPTPDKPVEEKIEKKPDPLPEQPSEVTLPPETPAPQTQPVTAPAIAPAPATTAEQAARSRAGAAAWYSQIAAMLEHNIRYPEGARSRSRQGVTQIAFAIDRNGHVLWSRILTSSRVAALDEEALALVQRVQPFPAPPPTVPGDEIKFAVPVRFGLSR